jgi:hypothetical protein
MDGCNNWRGHKWSTWGEPEAYRPNDEPKIGYKQERRCERCNMLQVYRVTSLFAGDRP